MKSSLLDVPAAIALSRATKKNIHENLFWAFFYNIIGIPLAAGLWIPVFGWQLNPMFGALAMSLSSFCVVSNALRLNWINIHRVKADSIRQKKSSKTTDRQEKLLLQLEKREEISTGKEADNDITFEKNKSKNQKEGEEMEMKKIMKIEGMMCGHCEAAVKKALEALPQVEEAKVSHEDNMAVVTLKETVDNERLIKAVEDKDYKVLTVE